MGNDGGKGHPQHIRELEELLKQQAQGLAVHIEVIPPCPEWEQCKMPRFQSAAMIIQRRGQLHWVGSIMCFRCSRMETTDLFEDIDSKIISKDPAADRIVKP